MIFSIHYRQCVPHIPLGKDCDPATTINNISVNKAIDASSQKIICGRSNWCDPSTYECKKQLPIKSVCNSVSGSEMCLNGYCGDTSTQIKCTDQSTSCICYPLKSLGEFCSYDIQCSGGYNLDTENPGIKNLKNTDLLFFCYDNVCVTTQPSEWTAYVTFYLLIFSSICICSLFTLMRCLHSQSRKSAHELMKHIKKKEKESQKYNGKIKR